MRDIDRFSYHLDALVIVNTIDGITPEVSNITFSDIKVKAHVDRTKVSDPVLLRDAIGNGAADALAVPTYNGSTASMSKTFLPFAECSPLFSLCGTAARPSEGKPVLGHCHARWLLTLVLPMIG